jgi:Protein  of unknown function (DUF3018)
MGKHEVIKPSSTARVAKHRAAMRAKGYRLKSIWLPDMRDPKLQERLREESRLIASRKEEEAEVDAWCEAMMAGIWDDEPDYKW